jgi:maleate cis-trans isomerase
MPDRFGPRGVCAVIIPQQNANMQPEYEFMRPADISNQMYRFDISVHDKVPEAVLKTTPETHGCLAALKTLGAKRIGVLSPMSEEYSKSVQNYYGNYGFQTPYAAWLKVEDSKDIIKVTVDQILEAFDTEGFEEVDTILHVGGALGLVSMLGELEEKLGRPIVSSNAAAYWYVLRLNGIKDTRDDIGKLWTIEEVVE